MKTGDAGFITTTLENALEWGRSNSIWPFTFGLALPILGRTVNTRYMVTAINTTVIKAGMYPYSDMKGYF